MKVLIFDTETSDKAKDFKKQAEEDHFNYPYLLQLGAVLFDLKKVNDEVITEDIFTYNTLVKPYREHLQGNVTISEGAFQVHGLDISQCHLAGKDLIEVLITFQGMVQMADVIIAHNINFDRNVIVSEYLREGLKLLIRKTSLKLCTMQSTTDLLAIPNKWGSFKWPNLQELHTYLFNKGFEDAHDAMADVEATKKCFIELVGREYYTFTKD
jgi:DNA polymerase III epsilon subunit-like protein